MSVRTRMQPGQAAAALVQSSWHSIAQAQAARDPSLPDGQCQEVVLEEVVDFGLRVGVAQRPQHVLDHGRVEVARVDVLVDLQQQIGCRWGERKRRCRCRCRRCRCRCRHACTRSLTMAVRRKSAGVRRGPAVPGCPTTCCCRMGDRCAGCVVDAPFCTRMRTVCAGLGMSANLWHTRCKGARPCVLRALGSARACSSASTTGGGGQGLGRASHAGQAGSGACRVPHPRSCCQRRMPRAAP